MSFLTGGKLLYNIVLLSAVQWCKSDIIICISLPSWDVENFQFLSCKCFPLSFFHLLFILQSDLVPWLFAMSVRSTLHLVVSSCALACGHFSVQSFCLFLLCLTLIPGMHQFYMNFYVKSPSLPIIPHYSCSLVVQSWLTLCDPWTVVLQTLLSMGF